MSGSSPTARLPSEILLDIFRLVQQTSKSVVTRKTRTSNSLYWLVITQVCRRWRLVAHSNSGLWRTFQLNLSKMDSQRSAKLLAYFLEKSNTALLRIGLTGFSLETQSQSVMCTLTPELHRVEELTISGYGALGRSSTWRPVFDMLSENDAPRLRALSLGMQDFDPSPDLSETCPGVVSFALDSYIEPDISFLPIQSIRQLHLISQSYGSWDELSDTQNALARLPLLEDLWFSNCNIDMQFALDDAPVPLPAVTLPKLRNLAFNGCDERTIASISGCFDMKAQEELAIMCAMEFEDNPFVGLMQALLASLPLPSANTRWRLHVEFRGERSSITYAHSSCALRFISRSFFSWNFTDIIAVRLTEVTESIEEFCLRILPDADPTLEVALGDHPIKTIVDHMFGLVKQSSTLLHHYQLPELRDDVIDAYLDRERQEPSRQTYHLYQSPCLVPYDMDEEMHSRFSEWEEKKRERGINNIVFHASGDPPELSLPQVCTSPTKWCWTWPGWGPNARILDDKLEGFESLTKTSSALTLDL